ncbi:hypothetical protein FHQ18_10200 [Deferribacter autotrophicus]|uniref:Uncharacterized protein n=1 Tax=Deferribacter autotrophicus TaxID=500465 RepID=A0A5A8F171_9BACT|nr:hypothetical protein [Deferribacter autotrophicus]KAA0257409.1 hypothetical protein FHQ18_10200 [Deferribacter autotrophicus]
MNRSFNTIVKYKNKVYHVQTEVYNDKVNICVFSGGMVVFKRNEPFKDFKTTLKLHQEIENQIKIGQLIKDD